MISGTCEAAHNSAATWMMNVVTGSPFLISLMATVASLPFFLFTLPAGVLADKVNRQKFVCGINLWLAAMAAGLAVLGWLHLLNPYTILASVFLVGVGFAFNAPAWTSIVPQVVSDGELPSAATLSGLQFNISGIIGPVLGGFLVPLAGANFVFAVNAACFLLVVLAIRQWKQPTAPAKLPSESFFKSFGTIIRYVRYVPKLQVVLARNFLFALFISIIPALMPVVGLQLLHLSSSQLGLLFTSMAAGSVFGAVFVISWLQGSLLARFSHPLSQFTDRRGLRVDGICSPNRAVLRCGGACRYGMDLVCFGTLGGSATLDAKLGARPHERHSYHDLARSHGVWGSDLEFRCRSNRTHSHLAWSVGAVPGESASGPSAFDQRESRPGRARSQAFYPEASNPERERQ